MVKTIEASSSSSSTGDVRWKYSTWFLTINTNQRSFPRSKLRSVLLRIFQDDSMFKALLKGEGIDTVDFPWSSVQFAVEVGPKTGYIHAHALVKIRHQGMLKLNIDLLKSVLLKSLNLDGIHLDVRGMGNSEMTLLEYLSKNSSLS